MELQSLKIRFYLKMSRKGCDDFFLYMRMLLSGKRTDISLSYKLKKGVWDNNEQMLQRRHPDRGFVMNLTNKYRQRALEVYQQMIQRGLPNDINIILVSCQA
jgi:hypothetical protein